ncbi:diiron oxygenase [soil metagenome]
MTVTETLTDVTDPALLDEEQRSDKYDALVARLNRQSVDKHFQAYVDIDWDAPEMQIDPADPRWELPDDVALGATEWYRSQPQEVRAAMGLHRIVDNMKTGLQFENILKRGLLDFAGTLPNGSAEFRYLYHEVIEEAQHGLMFQEFVNRSGLDPRGIDPGGQVLSRGGGLGGRLFPELFFIFVLGGEDPIDHVQRQALRGDRELHPLLERIMRIHVTEEARHLSFARQFLKQRVGALGLAKRAALALGAPVTLGVMADMMMKPSPGLLRRFEVPADVVRAAYKEDPGHRQATLEALSKVRRLCDELGIITPASRPLWKALGIWS